MFEDEQKARGVSLFVELASGSASFADVVSARYAEWRNLFRILKELKADETSALRSVSLDALAPTDFGNWGRERQPMFADEFGKFLAHEGCVEAVAEDLDARDALEAARSGAPPPVAKAATPAERATTPVREVERSFRRMKTPSAGGRVMESDVNYVQEKPARRESRSNGGGLGAPTRVAETREPARAGSMPPTQMVQKSPPPTPMPSQLSPPQSEYETPPNGALARASPRAVTSANAEHVEHLMSYLTGFHGLLFGLKDHVERIRGATIENVAHELARTDARLDTAIARLEAAMGVESGETKN